MQRTRTDRNAGDRRWTMEDGRREKLPWLLPTTNEHQPLAVTANVGDVSSPARSITLSINPYRSASADENQ